MFFEDDGQGKTLKNGLALTHAWEEPTKCVLDYFHIGSCPMIGISWGGYFAMCAAAFEPRISAVAAYDVADDGLEIMTNIFPPILRRLVRSAFRRQDEKRVNALVGFVRGAEHPGRLGLHPRAAHHPHANPRSPSTIRSRNTICGASATRSRRIACFSPGRRTITSRGRSSKGFACRFPMRGR